MLGKRVLELGSTAALVLAVGAAASGFLYYRYLNERFHDALEYGRTREALNLARRGADVRARFDRGETSLMLACWHLIGAGDRSLGPLLADELIRRGAPG